MRSYRRTKFSNGGYGNRMLETRLQANCFMHGAMTVKAVTYSPSTPTVPARVTVRANVTPYMALLQFHYVT